MPSESSGQPRPGPRLQPRDYRLLRGLFECRMMTLAHATALHFSGRYDACSKRVQDLKAAGYVGDALENACNEIAGVILLPKPILLAFVTERRLLDVDEVWGLIRQAWVSPQVLLYRLKLTDVAKGLEDPNGGLLAFVQEEAKLLNVVACHVWGVQARARFRDRERGKKKSRLSNSDLLRSWEVDPKLDAAHWTQDRYTEEDKPIRAGDGIILPCSINVRRINKFPKGYLLSIQVLRPPERV